MIDFCGNKSIVVVFYLIILLEVSDFDNFCICNVMFFWIFYIGWNSGVVEYWIFEVVDSFFWVLAGMVDGVEIEF